MTNQELADLIFPNTNKTIDDYEKIYPKRNLTAGAKVVRMAPSPTGFVHMGSLLPALLNRKLATDTKGIFYVRIEDTDGKRSVLNGITGIIKDLNDFDIKTDEGILNEEQEIGQYGPYIQSKRKEIYETYAKYLISIGYAYPCFCTEEKITTIRKQQEKNKERIGYYGKYAKCRDLTNEQRAKKIINGEKYIIRLKSPGDFNKKIILNDLVCGKIEMPENDLDIVLIKSDGLPIYHFAHVIDDHLMRTTLVMRGQEWISSTPIHMQLFKILGFNIPQYAHNGLIAKIDENGCKRKLSKRKDPEAAVSYYKELGIPVYAVKLYLMTIANSNFEMWLDNNKDKTYDDYKFDFKKMSSSGSIFDLDKLLNISKNYISRLKASDVYSKTLNWAKQFDFEFYQLLTTTKEYSTAIYNIERQQKNPRKDFSCYKEIKNQTWYMYKELFTKKAYQNINTKQNIDIIYDYINNYYNDFDTKEIWYNKLKKLAKNNNYAEEVKEYKENYEQYKGHVGDICELIRLIITTQAKTPDLYEILKLLGKEEIKRRLDLYSTI
ncbi:MAG: glutamate--tRNA ligase [Bacilli bacterium]